MHGIARAKVNLFLHIEGRRDDGLHLLESLVMFADFGDAISLTPAANFKVSVEGPIAPSVPADGGLVREAAMALSDGDLAAVPSNVTLTKYIPVGAGLGGGSADAALTARLLNSTLAAPLDDDALLRRIKAIGADLAACFYSRSAMVHGTGESIAPLPDLPITHAILLNPRVEIATAAVFGKFAEDGMIETNNDRKIDFTEIKSSRDLMEALRGCRNDLEAAAMELHPVIGDVIDVLESVPDCRIARMTGSGATCFGLFDTAESAAAALHDIAQTRPDWWAISTRLGEPQS